MKKISCFSLIAAGLVTLGAGSALGQGAAPVRPGPPTILQPGGGPPTLVRPGPQGPAISPGPAVPAPMPPRSGATPPGAPTTPVVVPRGAAGIAPAAGAVGPGGDTGPGGPPSTFPVVVEQPLPDRAPPVIAEVEPEPGGLTANEVSRRAIGVRPSLRMKAAQLRAADEKITQTMLSFFPQLNIRAGYTRLSAVSSNLGGSLAGSQGQGLLTTGPCPAGQPAGTCVFAGQTQDAASQVGAQAFRIPTVQDNYTVTGHLSIPISDYVLRTSDAMASSRAGREAARIAIDAERLRVDAEARALYFNWLRARAQQSIAKKSVEQTRARLDDAKAGFAVGAISKAELLRIQALVANTELVLNRGESNVALTTGQLAVVMEDWHPNYRVGEGIPLPTTIPQEMDPLDKVIAGAIARRLEVLALDETVKAYRRGGDATMAGAYPRLDATGNLTEGNPNERYFPPQQAWHTTWSVGLVASWTVTDSFLNAAAARELEQQAIATEAQRSELRAGIALEVTSAYLDFSRARSALEQQQIALEAAEEAYRVTTDLFRAGRATGTDLIAAEWSLLEAKLGEVNVRIDLAVGSIALRHVSGKDIPAGVQAKN